MALDDDDDELDDFFQEVSEAEQQAVQEEQEQEPKSVIPDTTTTIKLDHHYQPPHEETEKGASDAPPAKKPKWALPPGGVVVAAASVAKPAMGLTAAVTATPPMRHARRDDYTSFPPAKTATAPPSTTTTLSSTSSLPATVTLPSEKAVKLGTDSLVVSTTSSNKMSHKPHVRTAAGKVWVDPTLADWPEDDFRIFVGNLSNEVTDAMLLQHFASKYSSATRARVIRDRAGQVSQGYGFVSFMNALEMARALREMDQTWLSSRPIRIKRSHWQERELKEVKKKQKKTIQQRKKLGLI